jgi:hypothetical protein
MLLACIVVPAVPPMCALKLHNAAIGQDEHPFCWKKVWWTLTVLEGSTMIA